MKKINLFIIFIFLSSTQLMCQDIKFLLDSLQSKHNKSITINKLDLADKKLTIICSFLSKDLRYVLISKKYDIYISSDKKYYPASSVSITTLNDSISQLTMVFPNYIDTLENIDLFSDCETCFYFNGIRLLRSYDVLALENGSIINALIIEEGVYQIKYKMIGFESDSIFSISRNQVKCIRYGVQHEKKTEIQGNHAEAQTQITPDILVMMSMQEIKALIIEVGINEVKYKKSDYIDGPTFSVLKKDVYMIKYKNGQTDTLNTYINYQAIPDQTEAEKAYVVNTSFYGGHVSLGLSVGGFGLVGIPLRFYLTELVACDITIGARPMVTTIKTSTNSTTEMRLNLFYTGGFDIYFTKNYNPNKDIVQMNGLFIKGGGSSGARFNEVFGAFGWAYERYKNETQSFNFQLGLGLNRLHDKNYNQIYTSGSQRLDLEEYTDKPMLFWKFGWNFF